MPERRELPVEHRQHARLGRMEDHVVEAEVAVDDRGLVARRDVAAAASRSARPSAASRSAPAGLVLLRPARDLPLDVAGRACRSRARSDRSIVDLVQRRQHAVQLVVVRGARRRASCRAASGPRARGPRRTPSGRTRCRSPPSSSQSASIFATGTPVSRERRHHAILAIDRVRRRQQLPRRLAPQHVAAIRRRSRDRSGSTGRPGTARRRARPETARLRSRRKTASAASSNGCAGRDERARPGCAADDDIARSRSPRRRRRSPVR